MKLLHLKRLAVLAGLIGVATIGAALIAPTAASANVQNPPFGSSPGTLHLVPSSGASSVIPNFQTDIGCPAGFQATANVEGIDNAGGLSGLSIAVPPTQTPNPFSGVLLGTMGDILGTLGPNGTAGPPGQTYEFVVECNASPTSHVFVMSTFVTYSADGTSWTSSGTPPAGATPTTTTLGAVPTTALQGANVTLNATVTPSTAVGNVEFFDGTVSLGSTAVSGGHASMVTNTMQVGDHSITAKFEPTDSAVFGGSTSSAVTVTIIANNGDTGAESINVNVPLSEGVFTLTVSATAVQLSDAVNNGTVFESTGTLSDVTVSDGRQQSKPGWSVSGQVSDFTSGANTISGSDLGWTPLVKTPNTAGDVTAGSPVTAGTIPGLKSASALASAAAGHGLGSTTLNANLDLQAPLDTKPGAYNATLTVTAVESAS
ncbi:MAG TPA: Ig-like domain-containing protein [Micromonosporaceae bacterium]|nr:Ig-like domain-containing protein [Micromonosporaceae bacterium]